MNLLKTVVILTNPRGAHNPLATYAKMDEVQHETSLYVAKEALPAGVPITDPRWARKLDNSAAWMAEQERLGAEQERLGAEQERLGAEQERLGAEQERADKEAERDAAEIIRQQQEQARQTASATAIDNADAATNMANSAAANAGVSVSTAIAGISSTVNAAVLPLQNQLNTLVVNGDSSVEAAQARVNADGTTYSTLKMRLDTNDANAKTADSNILISKVALDMLASTTQALIRQHRKEIDELKSALTALTPT